MHQKAELYSLMNAFGEAVALMILYSIPMSLVMTYTINSPATVFKLLQQKKL